ncbi:MAG: preprotein translocase subunit SecD [Halolamina sp.]|uniref:preprotein translocase subunit SecD n=1 Tax=Halolamina sp. TaxID=1940283 RepID=UPI002FC305D2
MADPVTQIKENWRVVLLVLVVLASTFALFTPTLAADDAGEADQAGEAGMTNLVYGLELSGGTRIRAPLVGVHATGLEVPEGTDSSTVRTEIAGELDGTEQADVTVRFPGEYGGITQQTTIVEVTADTVTTDELDAAISAAGYSATDAEDGVSAVTRQSAVNVLRQKINEAGLSGGTVQSVTTATDQHFILIEVPNENQSTVRDLVDSRGQVLVQAYHQNETGTYVRTTIMNSEDLQRVGAAKQSQQGGAPRVPVVIRDDRAEDVQQGFVDTGLAQDGGTECRYEGSPNSTDPCILIVQDGNVINSFGVQDGLSDSMRSGEWAKDPSFVLSTRNFSEAQRVAVNLRAGALPAKLDVGEGGGGSLMYVSPSQSEGFKTDSLLTGIAAVLAVSGVVFARYGRVEVAGPMIVTAMSEVVILLGIAAAIGYPLDLSVIAGFIAAIGTGVDDLIIIADEVMSQGEVNSRRVFQSRFRKAFWVIGAAAATTIIALSPLAVLSLGDLKGFAIFTILGVIVGVLITRPAYGDILRALLTGEH